MDHFLGALLALKNDEGDEQAIYYLSRILIGDESRYNPVEKNASLLFQHPEDTTLFGRVDHPCHFQSQSFMDSHDKAGLFEL